MHSPGEAVAGVARQRDERVLVEGLWFRGLAVYRGVGLKDVVILLRILEGFYSGTWVLLGF